ncbi:hypothetical protein AHMF7605_06775 [Adhaeribacter arboris]|uniref:Uncharacterized protein n=2 Tax=Adhaeribacter arboris TaxID=2072846 RepID=A0A2T2YCN1_9BACT|nr:hypothetical protein AHMF7605_06775 [Adhaeribacter arboris]
MAIKRFQYNMNENFSTPTAQAQPQETDQLKSQANQEQELRETMDEWIGQTKHQLLLKWGVPTVTASDGNGGEILKFDQLRRGLFSNGNYITVIHTYSFCIDKEQKIYTWKYNKQGRQGQ